VKRVAILGADFAPSSLPPALRLRFFASHLPAFGWEPTVVTTHPHHYDWPIDPANLALLPPELRVIRTGALPARLTRRLGVGDIGMRSLPFHWAALAQLCARRQIDMLCIPVPPYVPMVLGRIINAQFGVPYMIDYIDPWVTEYYWKLPPAQRPPKWPLANAIAKLCEPFALRRVAHITGVSQATTDDVADRYAWLQRSDGSAIAYGGEPADFAYLRRHPRRNPVFTRHDGLLHLCHVGRGGSDMLATVRAIFSAFRLGLAHDPTLFERVRLHFVGTSYSHRPDDFQFLPLAEAMGLAAYVDELPLRVPYLDSLQILLEADALLAVGSEAPHYTASKIFPYILARRPLLAVFHEASSVISTLRETGAGEWVEFSADRPIELQAERIFVALQGLLRDPWAEPTPLALDAFIPFTARAMAARLAERFDIALSKA